MPNHLASPREGRISSPRFIRQVAGAWYMIEVRSPRDDEAALGYDGNHPVIVPAAEMTGQPTLRIRGVIVTEVKGRVATQKPGE